MGCTASNGISEPFPAGQASQAQVLQQQQAQARQQATAQARQREVPNANPLTEAPLVRSLVSVNKDSCRVEKTETGWFLQFSFSSLAPGCATSSFLVTGGDQLDTGKGLVAPDTAVSKSEELRFEPGQGQTGRLSLCSDLVGSLQSFQEGDGRHHVMLDLRADSREQRTVTAQRSFLKLSLVDDGAEVHFSKQLVECGTVVRQLDALYGTLPNPKTSPEPDKAIDDGGDCVICLSNPREVAIMHCRHVCLCKSCAQISSSTWSFQCPVCRGRVAAMVGLAKTETETKQS